MQSESAPIQRILATIEWHRMGDGRLTRHDGIPWQETAFCRRSQQQGAETLSPCRSIISDIGDWSRNGFGAFGVGQLLQLLPLQGK